MSTLCYRSLHSSPSQLRCQTTDPCSTFENTTVWLGSRADGKFCCKQKRWGYGLCWVGVPFPYCIVLLRAWSRQLKLDLTRGISLAVLAFSEVKAAGSKVTSPQKIWLDAYDDIFGLEHYTQSRHKAGLLRGSSDQHAKQFPCSSCRGRGYVRCEECDITSPNGGCSFCVGKGFRTCPRCLGERVVWEQTFNESSWDTVNAISLLKVPDDEAIESMEIPMTPIRKTNRVYGPLSIETREKIKRSLKELEQRTRSISIRMRNLHKDPVLHARRVAAIKKAKGTPEARQWISAKQKQYFSDPENRRKRSIRMKGVKYFCRNCGGEGHKKNSCPNSEAIENSLHGPRPYHCRLCLQLGHQARTCPQNPISKSNKSLQNASKSLAGFNVKASQRRTYRCSSCCQVGHSKRTCPNLSEHSSIPS
ncbi:hypothetical protein O6H91_05G027600 [Diphasiastrum complanatum]|uniref:Uncharacterized protein n=3 Tax=Diphasiastrum complanatum TaxID=34168 RepID=A0ACC2DLN1_DIPCM|nr:hypothetical protein O6H91_05G027100 [Diphasiastrum complanatum]KAJ7555234.1 hypothetical protein O6H91_05G027600 [Diphasiastrum complanatum]